MEPNKQFESLYLDEPTIDGYELKEMRGIDIKGCKSRDLQTVYIQLKIKGVKNATKEAMVQKIIAIYRNNETWQA